MTAWKLIIAAAFGAAFLLPSAGHGQAVCAGRDGVLKHLRQTYGETAEAAGVTASGQLVELLTGERGTFTILVSTPEGFSCLIAAGEGWQDAVAAARPGKGS